MRHPLRHQWGDVSEHVVHLTRNAGNVGAAWGFVGILERARIEARSRFGIGRRFQHCQRVVCLTEAPIHELKRIADRRSFFGFGFRKDFAIESGGNPVAYLYDARAEAAELLMRRAEDDRDDPIWELAPFMDAPIPGNAFEWEREWRIPHDFAFQSRNVEFLTAPEEEHEPMRTYLRERAVEPDFMDIADRPLIDLNWDRDRIRRELRTR